jgi:hypothetical protein
MPFGEQSIPQKGVASDQRRMNDYEVGLRETGQTFFESFFDFVKKFLLIVVPIVVLILFVLFIGKYAFFVTKAGYIAIYENPRAEELEVYMTPGLHTKVPFFPVTRYKQVWIVDFGTGYAGFQLRERKPPIELTFADTYKAKVPATFRYKLPTSENRIKAIHQDFTSFNLLIDALLIPVSRDAMVSTAALYTGEAFFQGGISQFKAVLEDQIQNGTYKTKLIEVEIKRENVAVGDPQKLPTQQSTKLWKTEPVRNEKGLIERLQTKSISDYGIELKQVTLGVPVPEPELKQLLADKKRVTRATIKKADELALILEDQKIQLVKIEKEKQTRLANILKDEAIQLANTKRDVKVQLANVERDERIELANTEKAEKVQLANVEKETKIKRARKTEKLILVQDEQKVQVAEKAKDLAITIAETKVQMAKKEEELAIAQTELDIQKANFETMHFEAKAILEKGNAEAEVLKAKYEARIPEIYHAEMKKDIAEIIYSNLKGVNVTMPHNIVNLGESDGKNLQTNLDILSSFATINVMEEMEKKALENNPIK